MLVYGGIPSSARFNYDACEQGHYIYIYTEFRLFLHEEETSMQLNGYPNLSRHSYRIVVPNPNNANENTKDHHEFGTATPLYLDTQFRRCACNAIVIGRMIQSVVHEGTEKTAKITKNESKARIQLNKIITTEVRTTETWQQTRMSLHF